MHKPSLLYASPLPPVQSGIAVYSRWLVKALSQYFDLTLYIDANNTVDSELAAFPILRVGSQEIDLSVFDHRLYHLGNHAEYHAYIYEACLRNPGWFVLHEFVLYYLVAGIYHRQPDFYRQIFRIGGASAVSAIRESMRGGTDPFKYRNPENLALNQELLLSRNRIIVHSDYTYGLVRKHAPQAHIYRSELVQGETTMPRRRRAECLAEWGIPPNAVVIASVGFVVATKLNDVVCRAVEQLVQRRNAPIYYLMVGEGDHVNSYLSERIKVTGYVPESDFDEYLAHVDLVINLRYPTMGETSAAVLRAFSFAKPCIVTDVGWFSELPDDVVLKIDCSNPARIEAHLVEALQIFLDCPLPFHKMGLAAAEYVQRRHSATAVARQYFELLTGG
jgi:glycosyltransferase involved in cell wall biosynthesis